MALGKELYMGFSNMLEILQQKNNEKIVLVKLGAFYIATGRDAVLLQSKLNLKCTCFKNNICKVGIPVNSIENYLPKLDKIKYSYIIYDYNKNEQELKVKYEKKGKHNKITEKNLNFLLCKGIGKYQDDEYMLAVRKLLQPNKQKGNENRIYKFYALILNCKLNVKRKWKRGTIEL